MAYSYTAMSLRYLREDCKYLCDIVERFLPGVKRPGGFGVRKDFLGVADIIAFRPTSSIALPCPSGIVAVQTTSDQQRYQHYRTISLRSAQVYAWLAAGGSFVLLTWAKKKQDGGMREVWTPRAETINKERLDALTAQYPPKHNATTKAAEEIRATIDAADNRLVCNPPRGGRGAGGAPKGRRPSRVISTLENSAPKNSGEMDKCTNAPDENDLKDLLGDTPGTEIPDFSSPKKGFIGKNRRTSPASMPIHTPGKEPSIFD